MRSKKFFAGLLAAGAWGLFAFSSVPASAADEDSVIAKNLYTKPLTHREAPPGFRNKPIQYVTEPNGFRDNPPSWTAQPLGYMEKPITQLEEPRNGFENPFNFVSRDATPVANLDEDLKTPRDLHPAANANPDLKIPIAGSEETGVAGKIEPRNPGYKGINPPSKVRLQSFQ